MERATVHISVFDTVEAGVHDVAGAKSLIDALKVDTFGRQDGRRLHYFGAIRDDSPAHIVVLFNWHRIAEPSKARTEIVVESIER